MRAAAVSAVILLASLAASHEQLVGRSVEGRGIVVHEVGSSLARTRVLVVGCIHGNERAGIAIARRVASLAAPSGVAIWSIPVLNPDGALAGTRGNGHGVDLNRNFPWRWRRVRGGPFDSGPSPLSEPESRAAARLILRYRPTISIWFHQHEDVVDESGGDAAIERRYARLVGLPLVRLTRYPGSVASWENHVLPGSTAFVVELPAGSLAPHAVARYARAIVQLAG